MMVKHHQGEKGVPFHIGTKVSSMESVPLCPNSNNQIIYNSVCMPIVKGKYFVLSFSCFANEWAYVDIFKMFQSSHMHIHVVIRMMFPTSFPHFILIVLKGESTLNPPKIVVTCIIFM
jgi:hypothetical protein